MNICTAYLNHELDVTDTMFSPEAHEVLLKKISTFLHDSQVHSNFVVISNLLKIREYTFWEFRGMLLIWFTILNSTAVFS